MAEIFKQTAADENVVNQIKCFERDYINAGNNGKEALLRFIQNVKDKILEDAIANQSKINKIIRGLNFKLFKNYSAEDLFAWLGKPACNTLLGKCMHERKVTDQFDRDLLNILWTIHLRIKDKKFK